ncbi:MAG: 2-C-methyl-D-erythritol 4-phosphate cytidylyltransferase [Ktedonobacteraceae bacterium]
MQKQIEKASVVIVAAGSSRRMLGRDKLWTPLMGRITLARTIDVFQASALIETIVIVTSTERLIDTIHLVEKEHWHKVSAVVPGGLRRQDSVTIGLDMLASRTPACQWVLIHDAARPFVTATMVQEGLISAQTHQASVAAVPVKDTIKQVMDNIISTTPDRSRLWTIQTPQVFSFSLIQYAHHTPLAQEEVTDDAALLERLGYPVAIFQGSYANLKITTQEDLLVAEALLQGEIG